MSEGCCIIEVSQEGDKEMNPSRTCVECERVFNLLDQNDANEYYYGHDCEAN
jgi:hypothetical protein